MRHLLSIIILGLVISFFSCSDDDEWAEFNEWRKLNLADFVEKTSEVVDGEKVYDMVIPEWNNTAYILRKRGYKEGTGTQSPYYTSTVAVNYVMSTIDREVYQSTADADTVTTLKVNEQITGLQIALQYMKVGDSCEFVIPAELAYGSIIKYDMFGNLILRPYSNLVVNIKLIDIPGLNKE